jgi:hypothetical protein
MKWVIARNEGSSNSKLIPGHKYEVLYISYPGSSERHEMTNNPKEPKFYIRIKDDTNLNTWSIWHSGELTYWNDYFLSSEEMRDLKIKELGI